MSPSTAPARILPSQQGAGPLQQGTGTDQTIGVPQLRPALALPLQRDTVLNQTVLPLQQGTSTNQKIAVPQVRPVLALPQGTVQTALPLPLQQGDRYQSDNWRWAGEASQRGHVNARSGCDR